MQTVLLFPGQGSQAIGMGKEIVENFPCAKDIFDRVDEALEEKLSTLIWDGDINELTLTKNVQPALMATSMAVFQVIMSEGYGMSSTKYMAGHSLGEYSALCAAGSVSLEETTKLLRLRGEAMQQAVNIGEGKMAAILGLDIAEVREISERASKDGVCDIANDNDPKQVVVSGQKEAVSMAMELATDKGARRVVELTVSAPFHCRLMQPAAEKMANALTRTKIEDPKIPVISNVTAGPVSNSEEIRQNLVKQVTSTVRWRESMQFLAAKPISTAFELGSGNVLTGLLRRIDRNIKCYPVGNTSQVKAALEKMESDYEN